MAVTGDIWGNRALNAEALGEGEKKFYCEIEPILNELLDELKANGKIEITFIKAKQDRLKNIIDNLQRINLNHNLLISLFDEPLCTKFLKDNAKYGFNDGNLANLYVQMVVMLTITTTELFKALILFHLRGVSQRVSTFYQVMGQFAPTAWQKLKPYVDSQFRNSLAHGTWALENKQIILFDDAELIPFETLNLQDFMTKAKKQNVLITCLFNVLAEKKQANFFT